MQNIDDVVNNIISQIDTIEQQNKNKRWTLDTVYNIITKEFPSLINQQYYNCIRTAIIENINISIDNKTKAIINILLFIRKCR